MNTTNFELGKELHELSGWESDLLISIDGRLFSADQKYIDPFNVNKKAVFYKALDSGVNMQREELAPAYDLGYLYRKLPDHTHVFRVKDYPEWYAYSPKKNSVQYEETGNSPEDALAKLAVTLIREGKVNVETN